MSSSANTASLSTDLNVSPYYDDYNEGKNFHRVLSVPGLAVQSRELTQSQTILQNQIDRFAEHVFTEGSAVRGCEMNYDRSLAYVKIRDDDNTGTTVDQSALVGSLLTGQTSGVTARVLDSLSGSEAEAPNTKTVYVQYTNSGSNNTTGTFLSGEQLNSNTSLSANVCTEGVQASNVIGEGSRITFGDGIIYAKDHFIRVAAANTIVGRYSANANYKIGYTVDESIVTFAEDSSLFDPAQGAHNYLAPGAHRLKLEAIIAKHAITDESTADFIERVRLKDGNIASKADKPSYSVINEYIARRTYDESGDYLVDGLNVRLREHLNSANNGGVYTAANGGDTDKLSVDVSPGKAYVKGFELENLITNHVAVDKGTDVNSVEQISIPANYGNYTPVNEVVGVWDLNGHDRVDLYDTAMNAISNTTLSSVGPVGSKIGEARVRALEYSSGSRGAHDGQYNMYLYDINMTANSFSFVRSIYFDNSTYDAFADTVLTANSAVLSEASFNRALFEIPAENIKTLRDTSNNIDNEFRFLKANDVTIAADGTVTLATAADEQFPFSTGALNDTQERENFHVVLKATANSSTSLDSATRAQSSNTITSLTSATTKYNVGDTLKLQGDANTYIISSVDGATQVSVYGPGYGGALSGATVFKAFQPGQVISMNGYGGDGAARSITINTTTNATVDLQETLDGTVDATIITELKKVDGQEKAKNFQSDRYVELNVSDSSTIAGPWNLGLSDGFALKEVRVKTGNSFFTTTTEGSDVTSDFELDTGMRDNFYDHSKLRLKNSPTHSVANGDVFLVKVDYFTHDTSSGVGYFSVDSYPIDDADSANTTAITTGEIPIYKSPVTGERYDLRNHIDIRPRITDTANNVSSLTNISRNPTTSTVIVEPASGLRYMAPNEDFITDFDYYLSRKDRIVITKDGKFRTVKGVPGLKPRTPPAPADGMTIAIVNVKPYPSLPQENAKRISTATAPAGRADLAIKIDPVRVRRYTMKDIQGLESRIGNLEYYTSLSLLESDTRNLFLADGSGIDRFKNGIIVDQFVDFTSSDFYDADYKIAIDKKTKELRPSFKLDEAQLEFKTANSSNVTATSRDTTITISSAAATYSNGEVITQGGTSGTLAYQVGTKLYVKGVSGTFTTSANVVGGTSTTTSAVDAVSAAAAGKLIMLPWTHSELITQDNATDTRNASGLFYRYHGTIELSPETDYWQDTTTAPSVQIDFGNFAEALSEIGNALGTVWGGWGTSSAQLVASGTQITSARTGTQINVRTGDLVQTNFGDSVSDVNLIPFIRSQVVNFTGHGLKPDTRVFAFFDDEDVNSYCSPANSSFANTAVEGSALVTDTNGTLYGNFRIPNNDEKKFPVGNIKFRLSDSSTNSKSLGATTAFADATFSAGGLDVTSRGTIVSTRNIEVSTQTVSQTSTVNIPRPEDDNTGGGGGDPIAQTFNLADSLSSSTPGAFLSKVDLYFASKDSTAEVQIELREVDPSTSYITNRVVPFSRVYVPAADINVSTDSSSPTPIVFETPVYLLNGTDYALIIKPVDNNPNVTVFTARLGDNDLLTGNRITKQPFAGVMFASANDRTWTALQEEDLKFKMYFASFGTNQTGTAVLKNVDREYLTVANTDANFAVTGETIHGETTLTLGSSISANVGESALGGTSAANGIVTFSSGTTLRVKEATLANKFSDAETITIMHANGTPTSTTATVSSQATPSGKMFFYDSTTQANTTMHLSSPSGTFVANTWIRGQYNGYDAKITSIDNLSIDTLRAFLSKFELEDTTTSMTTKLATSATARDSAFRNVNINADTEYDSRRYILSRTNEVANIASEKSGEFVATLTNGTNERHSPAIDNDRAALITVENLINNDSTNEDGTSGGNSLARYVQRTVTLAEGQDAEDLKVFLGAYNPSTASVLVYGKFLNAEDGETLEDKAWVQLTQVTSATVVSDSENTDDFEEYEFQLPTASMTGASGEYQYTVGSVTYTSFKHFKIKVVLLASSPSRVPRVRDLRTIALQI